MAKTKSEVVEDEDGKNTDVMAPPAAEVNAADVATTEQAGKVADDSEQLDLRFDFCAFFASKAPYKDKPLEFTRLSTSKHVTRLLLLRIVGASVFDDRGGKLIRQMNNACSTLPGSEYRITTSPIRLQKGQLHRITTQISMRREGLLATSSDALRIFCSLLLPALDRIGLVVSPNLVLDESCAISLVAYATRTVEISLGYPIGYLNTESIGLLEVL